MRSILFSLTGVSPNKSTENDRRNQNGDRQQITADREGLQNSLASIGLIAAGLTPRRLMGNRIWLTRRIQRAQQNKRNNQAVTGKRMDR